MQKFPNKAVLNDDIREWHFAGAGVRHPVTIKAASEAEAREKYLAMLAVEKPGKQLSDEGNII